MSLFPMIRARITSFREKNPDISTLEFMGVLFRGGFRVLMARIYLFKCNTVGRLVSVNGRPTVGNLGEMHFADEVRIWSVIERSKLYTGRRGKLIVGKGTTLNGVHIDAGILIQIGENCRIAPYTIILDSDFHNIRDHFSDGASKPIIIEDNVWIATRATILKGIRIGEGAVVAAGAVVTKDVAPYTVVAGIPAKFIKNI